VARDVIFVKIALAQVVALGATVAVLMGPGKASAATTRLASRRPLHGSKTSTLVRSAFI